MGKRREGGVNANDIQGGGAPLSKMKVTVCFNNVRVIVPCSNTEYTVRDLMEQAILRYKKATGKSANKHGAEMPQTNEKEEGQDAWVVVHKLKSQSDGGILDLDDKLIDVADDREQIMAIFEEDNDGITMPSLRHNAGDGTSASSVGTNSPDIFQGTEHKFQPFARNDIEITGEELNNGMSAGPGSVNSGGVALQVRRGSEPALNRMSPIHLQPPDPSKRWSAAPVIDEGKNGAQPHNFPESLQSNNYHVANSVISNASSDNRESSVTSSSTVFYNDNGNTTNSASVQPDNKSDGVGGTAEHYTKFLRNKSSGAVSRQINEPSRFSRDCNRLSMQFFGDGNSKWSDAADKALWTSLRKEPVGTNGSPNSDTSDSYFSSPRSRSEERSPEKDLSPQPSQVILRYEVGPLGVHLVPEHNEKGQNQGLIVQNVEIGGRIDRKGCLKAQDKIVEINGISLIGVPFQAAQDLFRQGLNSEELRLTVFKHPQNQEQISTVDIISTEEKENMVHSEERIVGDCKLATVSSIRKSPLQPAPLLRPNGGIPLIASNTRKIGRKYEVDLQKGPQGLGFSITTRDNPAGGNCPIYIKNILPHGAAIDDGRLRPGDRLLEVNGIEITGKTQSEAVSILKNIPLGGIVKLIVSRQERVDLSPKLPRQIPPEKVTEDLQPVPWSEKEVLEFDIPVLDTEKAGLGISVKGKTTTQIQNGMIDMGIFIKSVIHGGAASRDGRVKSNDQLLSVNGVSLLNCSNTQAMETLRKTMTQDGPKPKPGFITLMVARRVPTSSAPNTDLSGCGSSASGDEMDSWGGSKNMTVFVDGNFNDNSENISPYRHPEYKNHQPPSIPNQRMAASPTMRQAVDDVVMHAQTPDNNMQNVMSRSRSSSLRKIDVLKGKFEGNQNNVPSHIQRMPLELPRNPVLERLTGKNVAASRNDSYYKATTEVSFGPTMSPPMQNGRPEMGNNRNYRNSGILVQNINGESAMLEDDYSAPQKPPRRSRSSTPEDTLDSRIPRSVPPLVSSPVSVMNAPPSDVTYASQTSLEDAGGFSRDAFGRQSMSEKRHATLDAKSTDTYQRNKKLKEERERQKHHEPESDKLRAQRLAEERNLQDQWARRGTKRPFSSSTEDELATNIHSGPGSPVENISISPRIHWTTQLSNKVHLNKGKPGDRLGLGDQLIQLLHHWGQKRRGFQRFQQCFACKTIDLVGGGGACYKMNRQEVGGGLARVNSADSLVDSLKMCAPVHPNVHHDRRSKGKKDIGPSLGMKKSSSLESLQTMVQEIVIQEDMKSGYAPPRSGPQTVKVIRGRGCNESFRQAVDRSYEAPFNGLENQMETLAEEETESCLSGPSGRATRTRIDLGETEHDEKIRTTKKKPGLFRGLGSMFRFGRHRKTNASLTKSHSGDWDGQEKGGQYGSNIDPIQEQYRRLAEKRDARSNAYGTTMNSNDYSDERQMQPSRTSNHYSTGSGSMRMKKQSRKPLDTPEQDINGNPNVPSSHLRSASYDVYNEINRPGSRVGFVDPKKHSHYINYDEIKQHLNEPPGRRIGNTQGISDVQLLQMRNTVVEQRKKAILESRRHQQHYHSQRRESPRERHDRPVSNFYEYESVQAAMHSQQQQLQPQNRPANQVHGQGLTVSPQGHYGMNTVAIHQQQTKRNNNGITLPSPTVPLSMGAMRQTSQFQAVPSFQANQSGRDSGRGRSSNPITISDNFHSQSQAQRRSQPQLLQNSLPRRHHKDSMNYNQQQTSSQTNLQHRQTIQPQQFPSSSGRYAVGPPQSSYPHPHSQQLHSQNYGYHHSQNPQVAQQPQSSSMRMSQSHQHPNGGMYSATTTSMSVGSKV